MLSATQNIQSAARAGRLLHRGRKKKGRHHDALKVRHLFDDLAAAKRLSGLRYRTPRCLKHARDDTAACCWWLAFPWHSGPLVSSAFEHPGGQSICGASSLSAKPSWKGGGVPWQTCDIWPKSGAGQSVGALCPHRRAAGGCPVVADVACAAAGGQSLWNTRGGQPQQTR